MTERRSWLHGELSKEQAEELITTAPMKDGKFLVRARAGFPDEFVLSVTYRGKPTHHLVQRGPDGGYLVNKKRLGQFSTVAAVVEGLQNPTSLPQGWPVPLAFAVPASLTTDESHADAAPNRQPSVTAAEVSSSASSKSAPTESSATEPARVAVAPETAITPNQATGSNPIYAGVTKPGRPWFHGNLAREQAEELMNAYVDREASFLVRNRGEVPGEFVLSVIFKGRPTHHLIKKNDAGKFTINKKQIGDYTELNPLITALQAATLPSGWPVRLGHAIPVNGAPEPVAREQPLVEPEIKPVTRESPPADVQTDVDDCSALPWYHDSMDVAAANELMRSSNASEGMFFVRPRGAQHPGKPTHHLVQKNAAGSFLINGKSPGPALTLPELIKCLQRIHPFWPVALTQPILRQQRPSSAVAELQAPMVMPIAKLPVTEVPQSVPASPTSARRPSPTPEPPTNPPAEQPAVELTAQSDEPAASGLPVLSTKPADMEPVRPTSEEARLEREREVLRQLQQGAVPRQPASTRALQPAPAAGYQEELASLNGQLQGLNQQLSAIGVPVPPSNLIAVPQGAGREAQMQRQILMLQQQLLDKEQQLRRQAYNQKIEQEERAVEDSLKPSASRTGRLRPAASVNSVQTTVSEHRPPVDTSALWKPSEGTIKTVTVKRQGGANGQLGFGVAEKWRLHAPAKIVSYVDPQGPAHNLLHMGDEFIELGGEPVIDMRLDAFKEAIIDTDETLSARIFRPHNPDVNVSPTTPNVARKASVTAKSNSKAIRCGLSTKCSQSLWCPCPKCVKKAQLDDQKVMKTTLKVMDRLGGKTHMAVVLSRRSGEDGNPDHNLFSTAV